MKRIIVVVGTRPELIKIGCTVRELEARGYREQCVVVNTAQHKELLEPYWELFGVYPDITLDVMQKGQTLSLLTSRVLSQFQETIDNLEGQFAGILAQGDTTTVLGTAMVAFYNHIPFFHLEAGLRSFNLLNPYPEEYNRKATSLLASFHFCPTAIARQNLLNEGIDESKMAVVGNTVIDALNYIRPMVEQDQKFDNPVLNVRLLEFQKLVLITCHRRENHGQNLVRIIEAIRELARQHPDIAFIWTLHPNPNVRGKVLQAGLEELDNIVLAEPLTYHDLIKILANAVMAISDSGGIQEEAPSFNVPVLVLRDFTERPEGISAGISALVGADQFAIWSAFNYFMEKGIAVQQNPYGDGHSAPRVAEKLIERIEA